MLGSIRNFSKTIYAKILLGIIIVPFVFWGMGSVFRGGNTNVVGKINNHKISTKDFMNHLNSLNLTNEMIVVNEFNEELKNKFVEVLFKEKDITHLVSTDAGLSNLKKEYYEKYNITDVVLNRFRHQSGDILAMNRLIRSFGLNTSYLPDSMREFQKEGGGFPTTGVISIVYSVIVLGKKDIHIAGIDFYEKDYFVDIKANDHQKRKGLLMKSFIESFMEFFPEVNFTFYTNSSFKSTLNNVIIVNK